MEKGRCTMQYALIVEQNARFLSNQRKAGRFTAGTATESIGDSNLSLV